MVRNEKLHVAGEGSLGRIAASVAASTSSVRELIFQHSQSTEVPEIAATVVAMAAAAVAVAQLPSRG